MKKYVTGLRVNEIVVDMEKMEASYSWLMMLVINYFNNSVLIFGGENYGEFVTDKERKNDKLS